MISIKADIAVAGAGMGGCGAALAALRMGCTVVMTEETDWVGGQLTTQGVPPDEHPWIETAGCTPSYQDMRRRIREYYRINYPLTSAARAQERLNPGNAHVSRLAHEPRVAVAVLRDMLAPYEANGQLQILLNYRPTSVDSDHDQVREVIFRNTQGGPDITVTAPYFIDATELGDLLPMAGVEYVSGAESQAETGEPHAVNGPAQPLNMQALTYCLAMDYLPGEDHTIDKPVQYDFWRTYQAPFWPAPQLSWQVTHPEKLEPRTTILFPEEATPDCTYSLWKYRRLIDKNNFTPGFYKSDISVMNWPQIDYWLGPVIEVDEAEAQRHLAGAKQLSLSMLYWLQTEAPRPDGSVGYPGLRLRKDVFGTSDGLAKYPYIRESRRIKAEFTVLEQHIALDVRGSRGAKRFPDAVGVGYFRLDLHPSTGLNTYIDMAACPFQIPLGALIPVRMENLLAGAKNLGVTHITTGCYRLHPVEWNTGEAAGSLAAWCLHNHLKPRQVRNSPLRLHEFQQYLGSQGVPLAWSASIPAKVPSGEYGAGDSQLVLPA